MTAEILLVDDDPLIRTVVAENLSESGYSVHVAACESQAFKVLDAHPDIAVAIVDYCLPRPVGIGLCRNIAAEYPTVAVAIYTGHGELAEVRRGEDDIPILSKTMRMEQLVAAVEALFEGRRPELHASDMSSRVEVLWKQELQRETVRSVGRAMRAQFDDGLKDPLPTLLSDTVSRLARLRH